MAFEVTTLEAQAGRSQWVADRRLYLTADKSKAVKAGDPGARFLLVSAGKSIPREQAERLGLIPSPTPPELEVDSTPKEKEKPEDKQKKKPVDKSRFGRGKK